MAGSGQNQFVQFQQTGGVEVLRLQNEAMPSPAADEVLLEHKAIGLNYIEIYYRTGVYPVNLPSRLGTEAAGIVRSVGSSVQTLRVGDRVAYAQGPMGAYSRFRTISERFLVKIPDAVSFAEAAGMMLKGLTVQYLFRQTYELQKGQTVLFHAAAGGVGLLACQWARHLGVNLIGTVSSEAKAEIVKAHGAFAVINTKKENFVAKLLELNHGKKVPVVYDSVGKDTFEGSLDCLQERGLMVSFGNSSGPVTGVDLGVLSRKGSLYVTRPTLGHYANTPERLKAGSAELFDLVERKIIRIEIGRTFPLNEVSAAHEWLQSRQSTGSTVLTLD